MNKAVIARVDMNKAVIARVDIVRVAIRVFCACRVVVHLPVCLHLRDKKTKHNKTKKEPQKRTVFDFWRTSTCAAFASSPHVDVCEGREPEKQQSKATRRLRYIHPTEKKHKN
jgi:hypothetical protein